VKSAFICRDKNEALAEIFSSKEFSSFEHEIHVLDQLTQTQLDDLCRQALEGKCLIWDRLTASHNFTEAEAIKYLHVKSVLEKVPGLKTLRLNQWGKEIETWKQWRFIQKYCSMINVPWFYLGPTKLLDIPLSVESLLSIRIDQEPDFKTNTKLNSHENGLFYQKPKGIRVRIFFMGDQYYQHFPSLPDSDEFNSIQINGIENIIVELKEILGVSCGEFLLFYRSQELVFGKAEVGPSAETLNSKGFKSFLMDQARGGVLQ
jgi:hypothetical protein